MKEGLRRKEGQNVVRMEEGMEGKKDVRKKKGWEKKGKMKLRKDV